MEAIIASDGLQHLPRGGTAGLTFWCSMIYFGWLLFCHASERKGNAGKPLCFADCKRDDLPRRSARQWDTARPVTKQRLGRLRFFASAFNHFCEASQMMKPCNSLPGLGSSSGFGSSSGLRWFG